MRFRNNITCRISVIECFGVLGEHRIEATRGGADVPGKFALLDKPANPCKRCETTNLFI